MQVAVASNDTHTNQTKDIDNTDGLSSTQNVLKMYKQKPIGMFVRANLTNCA